MDHAWGQTKKIVFLYEAPRPRTHCFFTAQIDRIKPIWGGSKLNIVYIDILMHHKIEHTPRWQIWLGNLDEFVVFPFDRPKSKVHGCVFQKGTSKTFLGKRNLTFKDGNMSTPTIIMSWTFKYKPLFPSFVFLQMIHWHHEFWMFLSFSFFVGWCAISLMFVDCRNIRKVSRNSKHIFPVTEGPEHKTGQQDL